MAEVEIGIGKTARRAYRLDDVAIVPNRRTRDPVSYTHLTLPTILRV